MNNNEKEYSEYSMNELIIEIKSQLRYYENSDTDYFTHEIELFKEVLNRLQEPEFLCHTCARELGWNGIAHCMQGIGVCCDCCGKSYKNLTTFTTLPNGSTTNYCTDGNTCFHLMFIPTWKQIATYLRGKINE
ncbi:MAG TPA: hypothetical protein VKR58_05740 [Aquella sp.]|nr:hypothetical protein [Aquella sp.]